MSAQPVPASLRDFLKDLSAIREKKKVSLEEIRDATKVYPHLITQFEQDGLCDHPLFNHLYIRAFVRGYARVIGLSADEVADLYEKAQGDVYRRELAVQYLGLPPFEELEEEVIEEPIPVEESKPATRSGAFEEYERMSSSSTSRVTWLAADSGSKEPDFLTVVKGAVASILSRESAFIQWGIIAIGGGIGLLLILQLLPSQPDPDPLSALTSPTPAVKEEVNALPSRVADEAMVEDRRNKMQAPVRRPISLADSLDVHVVASTGNLAPFRARVDDDLRRPYWLNVGDSMRFRVRDRIVLEDNLEDMQILLEGHRYPILSTDSTATVVITRDTAMAFLAVRQ